MRRRPERTVAQGAAALAGVLLVATVFAGEAFWLEVAALGTGTALLVAALLGVLPLARGGALVLASLLAIAAWSGASVVWSVAPDRSWDELNRVLVYAAFAAAGVVVGSSGPRAARTAAGLLTLAFGLAVVWALAGKAIPALFPDGGRAARLRDPVGYWNALALVADALLVLGLWLAGGSWRRAVRVTGAVLAYAAIVAILLSGSRAGVAAAAVGVALWLALGRPRVERALPVVATGVPAVAVAVWAFTRPALVDDGQTYSDRLANGVVFGVLLVVGAALAAAAAERLRGVRLYGPTRQRVGLALAAVAVVGIVGGAVAAFVSSDPLVGGRSVAQGPGRLFDTGLNNRREFWGEAWSVYRGEPAPLGAGAGTFEVARKRYRDDAVEAVDPHDLPLRFLAGTGLVGLALFAGLVAAVSFAAARALRREGGEERRAALAVTAVPAIYAVHALVDYDWSFTAVTGPTLFAAGALATIGAPLFEADATTRRLLAGAAVLVAAAGVLSVATPWLADRALRDVNRHLDAGDVRAAVAAAGRAQRLDPLAIEPLHARAGAEAFGRRPRAAREAYAEAVRLQPENPDTWFALGFYEHSRRLLCQAYVHLNEAYTLDPRSTRFYPGGPLDEAREFVNDGGCEPR